MNYYQSSCYETYADPPTFPSMTFPADYQNAEYLGKEPVGNLYCDHWYQIIYTNSQVIDLDVYSNGTTMCRVSINYRGVNGMVWVFDGFSTDVGDDYFYYCNPTQNCQQTSSTTCVALSNATDSMLKNAIAGACAGIDCSSIISGPLMNDTLLQQANFAVAQYYAAYAVTKNDTCDWDGAAAIVEATLPPAPPPPTPPPSRFGMDNEDIEENKEKRATHSGDDNFILFSPNIACDDGLTPWVDL